LGIKKLDKADPMKKIGRPAKYERAMCIKIVDLMREGASKTEVAALLDISRDTMNRWEKDNREFSDAIKRGSELSQAWWEKQGRIALRDKSFSYTGWYMNMKNRFGWKDRNMQENLYADSTGKDMRVVHDIDREIVERFLQQRLETMLLEKQQQLITYSQHS
jgi:restriction endonuclease Mrr